MTERATKSGLALEAQRKIQGKYDSELAEQLLEWVAQLTEKNFSTSGDVTNFLEVFRDGTVLCSLANALQPGSVKKINASSMAFKQMENISFFLSFVEKHVTKSELFQTVDLFEGQDLNAEAKGQKREWSEEKLRAGETIIGLQMGTNKGANASGINMGNTRHISDRVGRGSGWVGHSGGWVGHYDGWAERSSGWVECADGPRDILVGVGGAWWWQAGHSGGWSAPSVWVERDGDWVERSGDLLVVIGLGGTQLRLSGA
uniref:Calponin-homology (CH) domain-containing protein n=1 Tax=Loa loa TaxID=7209 RepID=A0A1I7VMP7_LOALO